MSGSVLGVVIVSYNTGEVLLDCLASLLAARDPDLRIVVVDNDSTDDTVSILRDWASGKRGYVVPEDCPFEMAPVPASPLLHEGKPGMAAGQQADITLLHAGRNAGFAAGVNLGLAHLKKQSEIGDFWILNPDCIVPPQALAALKSRLSDKTPYGLMGGRVLYLDTPDIIQIDGGTVNMKTGVTGNINLGASHVATPPPDPQRMDFIMGANMVASRAFYETVGPMKEDYFLYYEEVDWAMRRGNLPLEYCGGLVLYHRAGSSIGSPHLSRIASPFSLYFKHRARMMFLRRFNPVAAPVGYAYGIAKSVQYLLRGYTNEAWAMLCAINGLRPPRAVAARLSPAAAQVAFGSGQPPAARPQQGHSA